MKRFLFLMIVILLVGCESPTPTPLPFVTDCNGCERIAALETRIAASATASLTSSATPSATWTVRPSPSATPSYPPFSATPTATASPSASSTPTSEATATAMSLGMIHLVPDGIARAGIYLGLTLTYTGPNAQLSIDRSTPYTDYFPTERPPVPPSNCANVGKPSICWGYDPTVFGPLPFVGKAYVFINSTAPVNWTLTFTATWRTAEEHGFEVLTMRMGGGTPLATATPAPTPTRTPAPVTVIMLQAGQWWQIANPTLSTYLYVKARQLEGEMCLWDWHTGSADNPAHWYPHPPIPAGGCPLIRGVGLMDVDGDVLAWNSAQYGWTRFETSHARELWLWLEGFGGVAWPIERYVLSDRFLSSRAELEPL